MKPKPNARKIPHVESLNLLTFEFVINLTDSEREAVKNIIEMKKSTTETTTEEIVNPTVFENQETKKHTNGKPVRIPGDETFLKVSKEMAMPTSRPEKSPIENLSTPKPVFSADRFEGIQPHDRICTGVAYNARNGYNRHGIGTPKRFVAVMGGGGESWAVYVGNINASDDSVAENGDKVVLEYQIKQLIDCEETIHFYRF